MKNKSLALGIILLFTVSVFAQTNKVALPIEPTINSSKYIIGIGNEDTKLFNNVLTDLQANANIKVYAYCERNKIIGLVVNNNGYKSYDVVRDFLLSEYPSIALYRKEETILNLDCKDEILKQ